MALRFIVASDTTSFFLVNWFLFNANNFDSPANDFSRRSDTWFLSNVSYQPIVQFGPVHNTIYISRLVCKVDYSILDKQTADDSSRQVTSREVGVTHCSTVLNMFCYASLMNRADTMWKLPEKNWVEQLIIVDGGFSSPFGE